jgi:hypothetical protein
MFCIAAELSPPPEPFEPTADPEAKREEEITKMAEAILDKAISQLLKKNNCYCKNIWNVIFAEQSV